MKLYKLWVEIEEHNVETDEYVSLSEDGRAEPVPIAEFTEYEAAVSFAEALGIDRPVKGIVPAHLCN